MLRRSFLGSIIGTVLGAPFLAKSLVEPIQRVILPYHIGFYPPNEDDIIYQMPAVAEIRWHYSEKTMTGKLEFIAEPLAAQLPISIGRVALIRKDDLMRDRAGHPGLRVQPLSVMLNPGDTLKVIYNLTVTNAHLLRAKPPTTPQDVAALAERILARFESDHTT